MKKMLILALAFAVVMMFSVGVMAQEGFDEPDWEYGKGIFLHHEYITGFFDSALTNQAPAGTVKTTITNANTAAYPGDINFSTGDQAASVTINTQANIPCYIEMVLYGNAGWSKVKSLGSDVNGDGITGSVTNDQNGHLMLFAPNFGGFVGNDWNSIDRDVFSSIGAYDGVYLQACDLWTAKLNGNIPHYLNVDATSLTDDDGLNPLDIEMRYTLASNPSWTDGTIGAADTSTDIGEFAAFSGEEVTMQFRVPFDEVPAGQYNGTITFKVYSI